MLKLNSILLFSDNPEKLSEFYEKVFEKKPEWVDGGYYGYSFDSFYLTIGPHDKVHGENKEPERIMINFETSEVKEEFERIKDLGATVIKEPYSMGEGDYEGQIATFADPDGNFFQLMTPFEIDLKN